MLISDLVFLGLMFYSSVSVVLSVSYKVVIVVCYLLENSSAILPSVATGVFV